MNHDSIKDFAFSLVNAQAATARAAHDARQPEIDRLHKIIAKMKAALEECEDYFDNRADADGDSEGFTPNKEMSLLVEVREALGKGGY